MAVGSAEQEGGALAQRRVVVLLLAGYLAAVMAFMLARNVSLTPDRIFLFLLLGSLLVGQVRRFLREWSPFLALIFGYELLRGFADDAGLAVHVGDLIGAERALFGFVPTQRLQEALYQPDAVRWYDVGATILYFLHFPLPLLTAFVLWLRDRGEYFRFVVALLALSFGGFVLFLLFPAAPPWYAAREGYLPGVEKIMGPIIERVGWGWNLSFFYEHLNPNPVAAMPSLHAAYPWLVALVLARIDRRWGAIAALYSLLVWTSIIYLGEHYAIDALAGAACATLAYAAVYHGATMARWVRPLPGQAAGRGIRRGVPTASCGGGSGAG